MCFTRLCRSQRSWKPLSSLQKRTCCHLRWIKTGTCCVCIAYIKEKQRHLEEWLRTKTNRLIWHDLFYNFRKNVHTNLKKVNKGRILPFSHSILKSWRTIYMPKMSADQSWKYLCFANCIDCYPSTPQNSPLAGIRPSTQFNWLAGVPTTCVLKQTRIARQDPKVNKPG